MVGLPERTSFLTKRAFAGHLSHATLQANKFPVNSNDLLGTPIKSPSETSFSALLLLLRASAQANLLIAYLKT